MKGGAGFTIVETLIVLAVTMFIFISAVFLINGKQRTTSFNQSIRSIQNQLEQAISDVGSGYYESDGKLVCTAPGSGPIQLSTGSANTQGTNKDCLFMGKVLQFGVRDTDPQQYNVFTLVGRRDAANELGGFDLETAGARVVARTSADGPGVPNAFATPILQYGLTIDRIYYTSDTPSRRIGSFGIVSNVAGLDEAEGAKRVDLVALPGTNLNRSSSDGAADINNTIGAGNAIVAPPNGIGLCFASGEATRSGLISIGAAGRESAVTLKIFNNGTCS